LGPLTAAALTAVTALVLAGIVCWHAWQYRRQKRARVARQLAALLDQRPGRAHADRIAALERQFDRTEP
jgi:Flp pilus assembly protein TadB